MKQAGIYVNDVFCGVLTEDEEGYHFCYEKNYSAVPLMDESSIISAREDEG